MGRRRRNLPKNNQELKRLKAVTLLKAKVPMKLTCQISGVSDRTYYRIKSDLKHRRTWLRKMGSKGNSKLTKSHKLKIYNAIKANPFISTRDMVRKLELPVTHMIVNNYLKGAGFVRRKPHRTLDLTPKHIENRYLWAYNMRSFRFWGEVIFTDETSV